MGSRRKTWHEKMADKKDMPKYLILEKRFPCYNAVHKMGASEGDTIVLVNPGEVAEYMKKVPSGRITTITEICKSIARHHNVAGCCSLTTGIFIMTAANAAAEANDAALPWQDIPYWRTLKADGFLNEKYPGGVQSHKALLEKEGFIVVARGKRFCVENYCDFLITDL